MINDVLGILVADKYRIESLIREGESGDLYTARHEVLDKPLTVKILPPALAIDARWVKRFVDEARVASAVSHPNILNLTDFGTDAKSVSYAVFEPADGKTLRDLLSDEPAFDEKRALDITTQIAAAVSAAHSKNIVHGGLSPQNIFVNTDDADIIKVLGFGGDRLHIARDAEPQYLAPEQCTAFPGSDERSDVYAVGVMFFEMLSGAVPFDGATAAEVMAKQNTEPPPPLSAFRRDMHAEIEPIVLSAIAADPDRRYQTMEAFSEDLEILSSRIGVPTKPVASAGDAPKRNIWQTAFIALAGISVLAVALIYATSVRKTDPTAQLQPEAGYLPVQPIGPATGAQEESLARLPALTDAEIMATSTMMEQPPGTLPGGDGYNAWANGGAPPAGAPLQPYIPPGGQIYMIDPTTGSQFMPQDGSVILVPIPANANTTAKPDPTPKTPPANASVQAAPTVVAPKPLATPPPKNTRPAAEPKAKAAPSDKPAGSGEPED